MKKSLSLQQRLAVLIGALCLPVYHAAAQPPVVDSGECLYLVGAPGGAPAAETEERTTFSRVLDVCTQPAQVDLNRDGENMIQAWIDLDPSILPSERACELEGSIGHVFEASGEIDSPVRAWASMRGRVNAEILNEISIFGKTSLFRLRARVIEHSDAGAIVVGEADILEVAATVQETRLIDEEFGASVAFFAKPGRQYGFELGLGLAARHSTLGMDVGHPGTERWARYDSIEICLAASALSGNSQADRIERDLFDRACYPGLWLPEARGGRYESARNLVALRAAQATTPPTVGINEAAARRSIERADAAAEDGDHPRACRHLAQALHHLGTP